MPFGSFNIPSGFQRYIYKILAEKFNIYVMIYLDDIFIYTKALGQAHINVVPWVLKQLRKCGLFANLKKCQFYKDKVHFLGYVVLVKRVPIHGNRKKVVKNRLKLKFVYNIQVFLGFTNFYWRFI